MNTTFLLTCYNHSAYIEKAFVAIIKNQHEINQIIVCDDCSIDDSIERIEVELAKLKNVDICRIYNKKNIGVNATLNLAFDQIKGDIVICQSCDDESTDNRIHQTKKFFKNNDTAEFAISSYEIIDSNGGLKSVVLRGGAFSNLRSLVIKGSALPLYGMCFRNTFLKAIKKLPINISNEDDYIGFFATYYSGIIIFKEVHYRYRIHENSMSNWSMSNSYDILLSNFKKQQINRIDNFLLIKSILNDDINETKKLSNQELFKLVEIKISLYEHYKRIDEYCFVERLKLFNRFKGIIGLRDVILLIFGSKGLLVILWGKRLAGFLSLPKKYISNLMH